jgi:hypothetical protein
VWLDGGGLCDGKETVAKVTFFFFVSMQKRDDGG